MAGSELGLLDRIGLGVSGYGSVDPTMAAALGMDPQQMQRDAARQAIMQFLAAAGSAKGHGRRATIGDALSAGMQAMVGSGVDRRRQDMNSAYMAQQMKRQQTLDEQSRAEQERLAQLQQAIGGAELPESLKPYASILAALPPAQATQMIVQTRQAEAADVRNQRTQAAIDERQQRQFEQQLTVQERIAARQAAAIAAAGGGKPSETERLMGLLRSDPAYGPNTEAGRALRAKLGIGAATNNRGPAGVLQITANDMDEQIGNLEGFQATERMLTDALQLLNGDPESGQPRARTGAIPMSLGMLGYGALPNTMLNPEQQRLQSLTQNQVLDTLQRMKGNPTEAEGLRAELAGFNLNNSPKANAEIIKRALEAAKRGRENAQYRLDTYTRGDGGTILDYRTPDSLRGKAAPSPGRDFYPVPEPAGPAGPSPDDRGPPGAIRLPDGRWADPKTGRIYTWVP